MCQLGDDSCCDSSKTSQKKTGFPVLGFLCPLKRPLFGISWPSWVSVAGKKNHCHNSNSQPKKKKKANKSFPNLNHLTKRGFLTSMHLDCIWVDDASGRPNVSTWKKLRLRRGIDQGCVATLVRGIDQICKAWRMIPGTGDCPKNSHVKVGKSTVNGEGLVG